MVKKIISILLSIIIAMGTFTIVAFANEEESASESKSYIYCPHVHSEGDVLITQEEADASDGKYEATKLYPGDVIYFHLTSGTYINYNSNGAFSVDNSSAGTNVYVQDYISSQNYTKGYTVLGMGENTSVGGSSLNFVHPDGDFLYWVVSSVSLSSTDNHITIKAVWDVPEADGEDGSDENLTMLDYALEKIGQIIYKLFLQPFYTILRIYNSTIRQPLFDLLDKIFGDFLL